MEMLYSETYNTADTIAAEATPAGRGGISVIRISGSNAVGMVSQIFDRILPEPGCNVFGKLYNNNDEYIDDVVLSYFKTPNSYTGDDVIEISAHGSPMIVAEVLEQLYRHGARPALPGEFTFRAFMNGKIDLTQAEAVADLIQTSSREGLSIARRQISGEIGRAAESISNAIFELLKNCEIELDFSEEDVVAMCKSDKIELITKTLSGIEQLLKGYERSRRLRNGVRVAITGKPNVGKSSLFNALIDEERAIVHEKPGTTRDVIRGTMNYKGVNFELFDTAGIREAEDEVENEGIKRAIKSAEQAECILVVHDHETLKNDATTCNNIDIEIAVLNKIDTYEGNLPEEYVCLSALKRTGIDNLKSKIYQKVISFDTEVVSVISRERQFKAIERAKMHLTEASDRIKENYPGEIVAEELRESLDSIGELTGKKRSTDILKSIFSEYCIGK